MKFKYLLLIIMSLIFCSYGGIIEEPQAPKLNYNYTEYYLNRVFKDDAILMNEYVLDWRMPIAWTKMVILTTDINKDRSDLESLARKLEKQHDDLLLQDSFKYYLNKDKTQMVIDFLLQKDFQFIDAKYFVTEYSVIRVDLLPDKSLRVVHAIRRNYHKEYTENFIKESLANRQFRMEEIVRFEFPQMIEDGENVLSPNPK